MSKAMEELCNEIAREKAVQIARSLLVGGKLSNEEIAYFTELTLEEVRALADRQPA